MVGKPWEPLEPIAGILVVQVQLRRPRFPPAEYQHRIDTSGGDSRKILDHVLLAGAFGASTSDIPQKRSPIRPDSGMDPHPDCPCRMLKVDLPPQDSSPRIEAGNTLLV